MRGGPHARSALLCFLIGCLHGACALESFDHDPVVIIDENDVRRLGLAAKPRDTIEPDVEPVKPVVIIDENEVQRFNMPTKSSKETKDLAERRKTIVKESTNLAEKVIEFEKIKLSRSKSMGEGDYLLDIGKYLTPDHLEFIYTSQKYYCFGC